MLEIRQLRHLVVLARHLNYLRAAEELCITQPTLSRSIQSLERQLGVLLFDRDRGGVALTPQGRSTVERARIILTDADDLERASRESISGTDGRIRFGMVPMPAQALLQPVVSDWFNRTPSVTHEVVVRDVEALWSMLIADEIEFFVSHRPPQDLSLAKAELLANFPLGLVVRAGHPLIEDAPRERRFPLLRSSWTGVGVPDEVQSRVFGPPNIIEDFGALAGITKSTDAMWLTSAYAVREQLRDRTLIEVARFEEQIQVMLYALKRRTFSPLAQLVIADFRRHAALLTEGAVTFAGEEWA